MNYLQLVQRLKRETGRSGATPVTLVGLAVGDQRLADWVADAWLEVQRRRRDWHWMRKTVTGPLQVGVGTYDAQDIDGNADPQLRWLPQTEDYTVRVTAPGETEPADLAQVPFEAFQRRYLTQPSPDGTPRHWCESQTGKLLIGPAPADAGWTLTADFFKRPTVLAADTDVPDMPQEYHLLLVWRALVDASGFDAAPEVEARARKNLAVAWSDLLYDQAPLITMRSEALC